LITSAEHYGAVLNLDFDYRIYFDVLAKYGLNYTRIYPGAYLEPEHYFVQDNVLGPKVGRHCLPWGRSNQPGYPLGGNLFDLNVWNNEYFERLKDFVTTAGEYGVVVEVCFFNCMYPDTWHMMPLHPRNHIQMVGVENAADFQTLKNERLVGYQCAYIRKLAEELNPFDNVILEICDEPGIHGTSPADYEPWLRRLIHEVTETEAGLPNRHLIAQQICGEIHGTGDVSGDEAVGVITGQYIGETGGKQFGGMQLLDAEYGHNKPIELNETAYYPIWYKGDVLGASRVEAWEFMLGGGAGFNQLNGLFSTFNPAALGTEIDALLGQLKVLKDFLYGLDFVHMRKDAELVSGALPVNTFVRGMSESGRQYALYIHHSENKDVYYIVQPGDYCTELALRLEPGHYRAEWVNPASGDCLAFEVFDHAGGARQMTTPRYTVDLALRIRAVESTGG
jgi:hypothetical protein